MKDTKNTESKCVSVEELVDMATSPKLKGLINNLITKAKAECNEIKVFDSKDTFYDVELAEDFGESVVMWFEPSERFEDDEDLDGWTKDTLEEGYADLLEGWNWDNVKLNDGSILIITDDEFHDGDIIFTIFNHDKMVDGAIANKYWLGVSVDPTEE